MKDFKWFLVTLTLLMVGLLVWISVDSACAERYTVCTVAAHGGLNVRLGPDTEYKVSFTLSDGSEIVVADIQNNWGLITTRNLIGKREPFGWVCMDYLIKNYEIEVDVE